MSDTEVALEALEGTQISEPGSEPSDSVQPSTPSPEGQVEEVAPEQGQAEESVFHRYKWDDGKEDVWKSPDELNEFIRNGALRHSDYTRKTQQVAEARKAMEQKMADYEAKERTFNAAYPEIMQMDKFLKEHPDVRDRIAEEMKGKGNPDVERIIQERLSPYEQELKAMKEAEEKRQADAEREAAFKTLEGRIEGFDRSIVERELQRLEQIPPQAKAEELLSLLYFANRGRETPGEIERRKAMQNQKPKPNMTPSPTVQTSGKDPAQMSAGEAADLAESILGQVS